MKPYVSTIFKSAQEFEDWIRGQEQTNKDILDTISEEKIAEWNAKGCNLAFENGKVQLLALNGDVLAEVTAVNSDEQTIFRDETTGAITVKGIKDINGGRVFNLWVGTTKAFEALLVQETDTIYIKTDDTTIDDLFAELTSLRESVAELNEWKTGITDENGNVKKAKDADTLGKIPYHSFRGHGTGFHYECAPNANIDTIKYEEHLFVINATGTLPSGVSGHGFLDVDYFDGDGFAPNASGAEPITKQTFRHYSTNKEFVRLLNHNTSSYVNPSGKWGAWVQTAGDGLTVTKASTAAKADFASEATKALTDIEGNIINSTYSTRTSLTVDATKQTVEAPIGSLLTAMSQSVDLSSYMIGDSLSGEPMYVSGDQYGKLRDAWFVHFGTKSTYDFTLKGTWRMVGLCGYGNNTLGRPIFLIQRVS